jgi:hypothetical protein
MGENGRGVILRRGENELRCRIPKLPLRPEAYAIRGGVSDVSTLTAIALLGYRDTPGFFTVKSVQTDRTGNIQARFCALWTAPRRAWL